MDADKYRQFDFFKSKKEDLVAKRNSLLILLAFIVPSALFISLTDRTPPPVNNYALGSPAITSDNQGFSNSLKFIDNQESFIDIAQGLNAQSIKFNIVELDKIGFHIRSIYNKKGFFSYIANYNNIKGENSTVMVLKDSEKIHIIWKDVSNESELLSSRWDSKNYPLQVISKGIKKDVELVIPNNLPVKDFQATKDLELKFLELQKENVKIKKEYSQRITTDIVKQNPLLKGQEKDIKKYVELILTPNKEDLSK